MHRELIVDEFTKQAETFNRSAAANDADTIAEILRLATPQRHERWLDAACGTGVISRALSRGAGEVHGVDATAAMIEVARREAAASGLSNLTYAVGDATELAIPEASYDGAVSRFAIHHIPVPGRLLAELARVVRRDGRIIVVDHLADPDGEARAWAQEIERLRDPSHWACLTQLRLRDLAVAAGLQLESERLLELRLDFEDWLLRGSGGRGARDLIDRALAERPGGTPYFAVGERDGRRTLSLRLWLACWRR